MQIFTSNVIEQKFVNSDNSEFSAKTTILTQNEIDKLENPDFYSQAIQNSCTVFIFSSMRGILSAKLLCVSTFFSSCSNL